MFILLSTDQSSDDEEYQVESEIKGNENNENEDSDDNETDVKESSINWRDNLAQKARTAYLERQSNTQNLMKIVYGAINAVSLKKIQN